MTEREYRAIDTQPELNAIPTVAPAPNRPTPPLLPFGSIIDRLTNDADSRHMAKLAGNPFGAMTGFSNLDIRLGGALEPGLHIVHGSPGVGKTAFALQVGSSCGCPCLFVTCEMTPIELLRRHTARVTKTYLSRFRDGTLSGKEVRTLATRAAKAAPFLAILDATETPATISDVLEAAEITRAGEEGAKHLLIIVDSLHSWADAIDSESPEYDRLNNGLALLRLLSKRLNCPVIAIAERNRSTMKTGGQSSGAGTRKIEYGAETVIELDAKDEQDDVNGFRVIEAKLSKNRSGSTGKPLKLLFNGGFQNYEEPKL